LKIKVDLSSLAGEKGATDLCYHAWFKLVADPEYIPVESIGIIITSIKNTNTLVFNNEIPLFDVETDITV
jgi:L-serine dehydratase